MRIFRFISTFCLSALILAAALSGTAQARIKAAIVIDAQTGTILYRWNEDRLIYPASLTKMMTLYLAFEAVEKGHLSMDQRLPVSRNAARQPRVRLGLKAGSTIRLRDAVMSMIVRSSNDSAVVVAEAIAKTEAAFARKMTRKARELGMTNTTFRNANGLPDRNQKSTARDMATLSLALIRDFPRQYSMFSAKQFHWKGRTKNSTNRLLTSYPGVDGLKTGYINASGYNLAASAVRHGRRLVAVYIGEKTGARRDAKMQKILSIGFRRALDREKAGTLVRIAPPPRRPGDDAPRIDLAKIDFSVVGTANAATGLKLTPPPRKPGDYGVQVGAFRSETGARNSARNAVSAAPSLLQDRPVAILERDARRGKLYRAQVHDLSLNDAKQTCRQLKSKSLDCMVVRTQ